MPSAKISFLSAIVVVPYVGFLFLVFVSLGTKSKNVTSKSGSDRTGRTDGMDPDMLQKLIILYPTNGKNASPFLRFF